MSLYSLKKAGGAAQTWAWTWTPGANLANFFALYDSRGDVTISVPTSIATNLDGPIQVVRYGALVVNAALTVTQRCRGLMPIADSLSMGASGSISMTGMGAHGSRHWAVSRDIFVPQSITFTGRNTSLKQFLDWIRATSYCIFDPSMYAAPLPGMGDVQCDWATWTPFGGTIISVSGCGAQVKVNTGGAAVSAGNAGVNAPGSGATGYTQNGGSAGGPGRTWGGGSSGGSSSYSASVADQYGGPGGESVYAAGVSQGGGFLCCIVRGNVSLTAGHVFTANGTAGIPGNSYASGGSGGGKCGVYYLGTLTGTFNQMASGGPGGVNAGFNGAAGGAGHTESKTFAVMGY